MSKSIPKYRTIVPRFGSEAVRAQEKDLPIMPFFDLPTEELSTEVVAATEAGDLFPTDDALVCHKEQRQFKRLAATSRNRREELAMMVVELQANRLVLDGLSKWYGLFVFTGGHVPTAQWNVFAMTSYLGHPVAADCLSASDIQRYRHLAQAISELGQTATGPTTLRYRYDLGDKFRQAASEIRVLTDTLESSVTKAVEELSLASG